MTTIDEMKRKIGQALWNDSMLMKPTSDGYVICDGDTMFDVTVTMRA